MEKQLVPTFQKVLAAAGMLALATVSISMQNSEPTKVTVNPPGKVKLITLDPGHFHAALVQKYMYPMVDAVVNVYAPASPDVDAHLRLVDKYNTRADNPTNWKEEVYRGADYLNKMLAEKKGNLVVLAGNNKLKTGYIWQCVNAGLNVLADKPMAINKAGFQQLEKAFALAKQKNVLLYDIMTERYEVNSILQKELSEQKALFGELQKGTVDNPAVTKESVHHFFKYVSGAPLIRPGWFYDVRQQAEGLVDVTTHLVDLVQWECFPGQVINYKKDISMLSAKRWATRITPSQYKLSTNLNSYPDFLKPDVTDSILNVYSNGEMNYTIKGVHARVSVIWNFQAPAGTGDTHFSTMRGTKANVVIRQGKEQNYKPALYVEPVTKNTNMEATLKQIIASFQLRYPGLGYKKSAAGWQIIVPESFNVGHEEHFAQVTRAYLKYLSEGKLPAWEVPNMLAKYYTTTQALNKAVTVK